MAKKKKTAVKKTRKKTIKKVAANTWTTKEITLLRKLFPTNPTAKIAPKFKRSTDAVKKKAARMGLRKKKSYMKKLGRG